jgi:hypothetical protein
VLGEEQRLVPALLGQPRHIGRRDGVMGRKDRYAGVHAPSLGGRVGNTPVTPRLDHVTWRPYGEEGRRGMDWLIAGVLFIVIVTMLVMLKRSEGRRR